MNRSLAVAACVAALSAPAHAGGPQQAAPERVAAPGVILPAPMLPAPALPAAAAEVPVAAAPSALAVTTILTQPVRAQDAQAASAEVSARGRAAFDGLRAKPAAASAVFAAEPASPRSGMRLAPSSRRGESGSASTKVVAYLGGFGLSFASSAALLARAPGSHPLGAAVAAILGIMLGLRCLTRAFWSPAPYESVNRERARDTVVMSLIAAALLGASLGFLL